MNTEKTERSRITPYVTLIILWGYLFSVILATKFWDAVFQRVIAVLDLSPNQAWILPVGANLVIAAIGTPYIVSYLLSLRQRIALGTNRHINSLLCIAGVCLCVWGAVGIILAKHNQLASGLGEFVGGKPESVYAAGEFGRGSYSNTVVGVSLKFPDDWHLMSLNAMHWAKHSGAQAVFGKDSQQAQAMATERQGVYSLLALRKYPSSYSDYNPSLAVNAYEKQSDAFKNVRSLEDYAKNFAAVSGPFHLKRGPMRETFGTVSGYYLHIEGQFPHAIIQQHVYIAETDTLYLVVVASVMDDADLVPLKEAVSTLRIHRK